MRPEILEDERVDELIRGKTQILQKKQGFRFGTDAVLLADFALIKPRARVMDFGTGTGVIALLIASKHADAHVTALELQPDIASMARRSVEMNDLGERIEVVQGDIRCAPTLFQVGTFDQITCNPPYNEPGRSLAPESENKLLSRTEAAVTIDQICHSAFLLLKSGGRLSVVFPAQRLHEMLFAMDKERLAPKRVRCILPTPSRAPRLMLLDAVKHGGSQLDWLPPLILQNEDGSYTDEWHRIYKD